MTVPRRGVAIKGRSRSLKVNYRTSHQIRRCSDELLPETLTEPDGNEDNRLGVTSVFEGAPPIIRAFADRAEEVEEVRSWIEGLKAAGVAATEIVVLVRTSALAATISPKISASVLPMHEAKGAEFRAVAVMALDQDRDMGRSW